MNTEHTHDHDPADCQSYAAGHRVHWIQGLRSANQDADLYRPCEILAVDDAGWLDYESEGALHHEWVHNPARVRRHLEEHGPIGRVNRRWAILWIGPTLPFSISAIATPCVYQGPSGDPAADLLTHGGFTISGADAIAHGERVAREAGGQEAPDGEGES